MQSDSIIPYGDRGCLIRGLSVSQRNVLECRIREQAVAGVKEIIPGYESLLVLFSSEKYADYGAGQILHMDPVDELKEAASARLLKVPVHYNGPDLQSVAKACDLTAETVIRLHSEPEYRVRMMGFSPGFPYLDGLPEILQIPRRGSPRDYIQPGSVAIGGPHAGIYSVGSPGGWHILGHTEIPLFSPEKTTGSLIDPDSAFYFRVGDRVRFCPKDSKHYD